MLINCPCPSIWYVTCPLLSKKMYYHPWSFLMSCKISKLFKTLWAVAWDFQQCDMCNQQSLRSACTYMQSDQSLYLSLEYSMIVKLLTEHHLEFLSLKGGCTGSPESTLVKIPHCWTCYGFSLHSLQFDMQHDHFLKTLSFRPLAQHEGSGMSVSAGFCSH